MSAPLLLPVPTCSCLAGVYRRRNPLTNNRTSNFSCTNLTSRSLSSSKRQSLVIQSVATTTRRGQAPAGEGVTPKDAPLKSLFPPEPKPPAPGAPKLKVAIVGSGLAGLSTAVELLEQGYDVDIYESRPFVGGKLASYEDKDGNHVEMGLHVFFGCYFNVFRLAAKIGVLDHFLLKDHTHTFVNAGGDVRELDFRFFIGNTKIGAPFHGLKAFFTTPQLSTWDKAANSLALGTSPIVRALFDPEGGMRDIRALDSVSFTHWFKGHGGSQASIDRMWNPIAYALGFIDCDNISARCMLSIFQFFATKTDASALRMLDGPSGERLLKPITDYIQRKGGRIHLRHGCREVQYEDGPDGVPVVTGLKITKHKEEEIVKADAYVAALDVPGAKRLLPQAWRRFEMFDNIHKLDGVPVITVQLRYSGWVTELQDEARMRDVGGEPAGVDNLLYSADADFSCFADLALTSPVLFRKDGQGSLLQCVLTPADPYMALSNQQITDKVHQQVLRLFPSAQPLELLWTSVVKIGQSLYREAPGLDPFRPDQKTVVPNFFLAGSYTKQDYIDSMEGATLSGRQCANAVLEAAPMLSVRSQTAAKAEQPAAALV